MKNNDTYEQTLHRLASRCSGAELCTADIQRKLDATGLTDEEKRRLLRRLVSEGYVDDNRYAHAFVRDKFRFSGWGRVKIAQGLRAKQIPAADIDNALTEIDEDDYRQTLRGALEAKRRSVQGASAYETNGKLIRFALSRGFERDAILKELRMNDDD